jgi:hypothetical protein
MEVALNQKPQKDRLGMLVQKTTAMQVGARLASVLARLDASAVRE